MKTIRYAFETYGKPQMQRSDELNLVVDVPVKDRTRDFPLLDRDLRDRLNAIPGVEFATDSLTYGLKVYVARLFDAEAMKPAVVEAFREWYATANGLSCEEVEMVGVVLADETPEPTPAVAGDDDECPW